MTNKKLSYTILTITFILVVIGHVMIYSASSYVAERDFGDAFYHVKKQLLGFFAGVALTVMIFFVKTETIEKFRWIILAFSTFLMLLVFVPGIGVESYGAKRWINLGFTTIQPSEIMKFAFVIFVSGYIKDKKCDSWKVIFTVLSVGGVIAVMLLMQPNMSITVCLFGVMFIMLIVGGIKLKQLLILVVPFLLGAVLLILLEPYRLDRLFAFIDPWASPKEEGFQLIQSYYAIGSGGLFGVGLFNSRQKYLFLPFAESDFIFSVICEELGFVGCVIVLFLYITLVVCGVKVAMNTLNAFDCYLATGITAIIAVQTLINIAVVSGSIPPTGLPLPYMSAGGSSLAVFMMASGILAKIGLKDKSHLKLLSHKI